MAVVIFTVEYTIRVYAAPEAYPVGLNTIRGVRVYAAPAAYPLKIRGVRVYAALEAYRKPD